MKKMFAVSLVLAAALAIGCGKKNAQTMPTNTGTGDNKTEVKPDGSATGGDTYGGAQTEPPPADPCAAPN